VERFVIPIIVALQRCDVLSQKLIFPIFPPGHPKESLVLSFANIAEMDDLLSEFVTKSVRFFYSFI
jgi:hypothetical protein